MDESEIRVVNRIGMSVMNRMRGMSVMNGSQNISMKAKVKIQEQQMLPWKKSHTFVKLSY